MQFRHDEAIWREFPELVPGVMAVEGIRPDVDVEPLIAKYEAIARERLAGTTESGLPEIQAWRQAFSKMGLKPTQYRCASEALLRRFRKEDSLPAPAPADRPLQRHLAGVRDPDRRLRHRAYQRRAGRAPRDRR